MRKIVLLSVSLCLISTIATGQLSFGFKAGPSFSRLNFEEGGGYKVSFHAGGSLNYEFSDLLSFQPELLYSVKGIKSDEVLLSGELLDIELQYVSIPLLLGIQPATGIKIKVGPEINVPVSQSTKVNNQEANIVRNGKRMDLALCGGLSYQFIENFGAEVRYTHGLSVAYSAHFIDINGGSLGTLEDLKTRTWQLSLFYLFGNKA